ncbi:MAG: endolytic transglycosylase MltG [Candidatus Dormibacteria bacterium]
MRRHPVVSALVLLLLLLAGGVAALVLTARNELQPVQKDHRQRVLVTVARGESLDQLANGLQQQELVRSAFFFKYFAEVKGLQDHLRAGRFRADRGMGPSELVAVFEGPPLSRAFDVTVPDGLRAQQEAQLLQSEGLFPASRYLAVLNSGRSFPGVTALPGTPTGASWEGFAFGDTYLVDPKVTPAQLLQRQLQDFDARELGPITAGAAAVGLSPYQVVVLASIVSAEASTVKDRGLVAGVFFNRLQAGMPLQSDVTVLYAQAIAGQGGAPFSSTYPSPYNTYLHSGLPPGPIDSPGGSAIQAVLHPTSNPYFYFLALANGKVVYSVTLAQHQQQLQEAGQG